jgi:hypothetical protein
MKVSTHDPLMAITCQLRSNCFSTSGRWVGRRHARRDRPIHAVFAIRRRHTDAITRVGQHQAADRADRERNASHDSVSIFPSPKPEVVLVAGRPVAVIEIWSRFKRRVFEPYRPELHYMRGPGPKSRERARVQFLIGRS